MLTKREWADSLELTSAPVGFTMEAAEIWAIIRALKATDGMLNDAALLLSIGRSTLRRRIDWYGMRRK